MTTRSRICSVGLTYAPLGKREGPKKTFYFRLGLKEDQSHPHSPQNKITATADTPALHLYSCLLCYPCLQPLYLIRLLCQANGTGGFFFTNPFPASCIARYDPKYSSSGKHLFAAAAICICIVGIAHLVSSRTVKQRGTGLRQKYSNIHYTKSIPAA